MKKEMTKIRIFWKNVREEMGKILGLNIALDPLLFLLEIPLKQTFTTDQCYIIHILLMAAKKIITINWMKTEPLGIDQWLQKIKHIYSICKHIDCPATIKTAHF